jgi:uncharacterized protein YcbX
MAPRRIAGAATSGSRGRPWEEFDWIDRDIRIGTAVLRPEERTDRCLATHNNPETGARDDNILDVLDSFGHRDFTVRAGSLHQARSPSAMRSALSHEHAPLPPRARDP